MIEFDSDMIKNIVVKAFFPFAMFSIVIFFRVIKLVIVWKTN